MEMSFAYLRETIAFLETRGFGVTQEEAPFARDGTLVYTTHTHILTRGTEEVFVFECVRYPSGEETYWLEIRHFHGLRTYSQELDSWKYRDDRLECKYYARADGVGLSFILALPPPDGG